jgi:Tfp pilus assembly protein PilO
MKEFWAQRNPRERYMLFLCAIVIVVGGWMGLSPTGDNGKTLLPTAQARQKIQETSQQKQALDDESVRLKAALGKMVYTDPPDQLVPQVVRTLQGYARDSGIHLREIKPMRARRFAAVTKVPLSVRFTTEFSKSVPFLYKIEDPAGKLVVEKFNVTASDPKSRTVDVEAQVALFTQADGT